MKSKLEQDLYRYTGEYPSALSYMLKNKIFRFQYFYRKAFQYRNTPLLGIILRFIHGRLMTKYGSFFEVSENIEEGLLLLSPYLLCINGNAKVGKNCTFSQGVTLGISNRGKYKGCPVLGDNVWIGAYTVIVGKVHIGNNVRIEPNTYINTDVPDNSIVFGNPAQIIYDENPVKDYIINPILVN